MGNNDKTFGMSGGVPAGWVLVPIEPTLEMYEAGYDATRLADGTPQFANAGFCLGHSGDIYRAMLAATPTPPIEGRDADVERVAEALWKATPYYDGTPWDHFSFRRYGGTSDTRELYLTMARAALQALGERP